VVGGDGGDSVWHFGMICLRSKQAVMELVSWLVGWLVGFSGGRGSSFIPFFVLFVFCLLFGVYVCVVSSSSFVCILCFVFYVCSDLAFARSEMESEAT